MATNRIPLTEYARKQLGIGTPQTQRSADERVAVTTKCAGCAHRADLDFDCAQYEQRGFQRDGRLVVTWCDGFKAVQS